MSIHRGIDKRDVLHIYNGIFWTVVLEKTLERPLDCKEIQPVHPKGNQSWIFIGRTDADTETPILWPPDVKNWLIWKDPNSGKDWRQEEEGMTEDEMVGWHHWFNGHKFEPTPGDKWRTEKPGVLQSMGLQRVGHDWVTELNWTGMTVRVFPEETSPWISGLSEADGPSNMTGLYSIRWGPT